MKLSDYANAIADLAVYPDDVALRYCGLGLVGEAGEVANQVKKIWRDDGGVLTPSRTGKLQAEMGDVIWYAARFAFHLGIEVDDRYEPWDKGNPVTGRASSDIFFATENLSFIAAGCVSPEDLEDLEKIERIYIVDTLFRTLADVADLLGTNLNALAANNLAKLTSRKDRGVLQGSGDDR